MFVCFCWPFCPKCARYPIKDYRNMAFWSPDGKQIILQLVDDVYHNYILDVSSMNLMRMPEPLGEPYPLEEWIVNGE